MAEVISRNEFDRSYLLMGMNDIKQNYVFKMITKNKIPGLLECKVRYLEETAYLAYDVTSKRTLEKEFADKKISFSDLTELFYEINKIIQSANDYLLDGSGFRLRPEYMYKEMETGELSCLYTPVAEQESKDEQERYRPLADFLLDKIDHKDEHAVSVAYHFYKISKEEYFSFDSFVGFLEKEYLLVQAENQRKEQKVKMEEAQMSNDNYIDTEIIGGDDNSEKEQQMMSWKIIIAAFVLGLLFFVSYFCIPFLREYVFFVLLPGVACGLFAIWMLVRNFVLIYRDDNRIMYREPEEPVRIEEYFDNMMDDVTVFFDQEEYLHLKWKEGRFSKEYTLEKFPITVGKMKENVQMVIEDASVSRLHARFRKNDAGIYLQDLDSTNGTYVNEKQLHAGEEMLIKRGDEIQFGKIIVNVV